MMIISSVDGYDILVDDEDYELVSQFEWVTFEPKQTRYARGYYRQHGYQPLLHSFIMKPEEGLTVDHINGNGLDCRRSNMRVTTYHQNSLNRLRDVPTAANNVGVYKQTDKYRSSPWYAELKVCGKKYKSKKFATEEEACRARNEMISQYITVL